MTKNVNMPTPDLGSLIEGEELPARDAIHIAVAPVVAAETLSPGQKVKMVNGRAEASSNPDGVVDPFLPGPIFTGGTFWLMLFPNTITSLRHEWTHPHFERNKMTLVGIDEGDFYVSKEMANAIR